MYSVKARLPPSVEQGLMFRFHLTPFLAQSLINNRQLLKCIETPECERNRWKAVLRF